MFYKIIQKKRDQWFSSANCPIGALIEYMTRIGQMRDAQVEAIKTYLFLKIACGNRPLHELFTSGAFNNLNLDDVELTARVKTLLQATPAAAALFEYVSLPMEDGTAFSPKIVQAIKTDPEAIDYGKIFQTIFYDISYTDYLFSLPMGAGKTYLMAAFIYLDLYFAENEPDNPVFAHNFIIFAPSGLKSSVIPSLRTIQHFDPAWIIPEPAASNLKRKLVFEVLDQDKTANRSNKTKNPNVQKIAVHQPLEDLFGLVAVTNAEKVILDRVDIDEQDGQLQLIERSDDGKDKQANELRHLIGELPHLAVFIDEVHHAATDDKKLRAVVNHWMRARNLNSVIGFSGTPYLQKAEKIAVTDKLSVANIEISNIVHYYPLVDGIGNFLKKPTVRIATINDRLQIVGNGIREFLTRYRDTVYPDGTGAKLGIYCGTIETLEEQIYPLAGRIAEEFHLNPTEAVLRFHKGNKQYPVPVDGELQFLSLDKPFSKVRIVLLVQIGKEGWDCRSLTGIVLSQEGDCPTNMVLQASCRCLRQVQKGAPETALIYLNETNAKTLNLQLEQQQHISIQEFERGNVIPTTTIFRYDRTGYLELPRLDFYQLKIRYKTLIIDEGREAETELACAVNAHTENSSIIKTAEAGTHLVVTGIDTSFNENGRVMTSYSRWLYGIAKESFGFVTLPMLEAHDETLKRLFEKITYLREGVRYFSSRYKIAEINANIRKAFYEKRSFESAEELIPEEASLLKVDNLTSPIETMKPEDFHPAAAMVERILRDDRGELKPDEKLIQTLEAAGRKDMAEQLRSEAVSHPMKDRSFHYLPYKTDSRFERLFLEEVLKLDCVKNAGLEVYYNGDRVLTEFQIKCYKRNKAQWNYIGMYTPDFLIIRRKDGAIHQAIIVETKGRIYANDPTFCDKRNFMEAVFTQKNNDKFGYRRFDYLYLEDSMRDNDRINAAARAVNQFFQGE